MFRSMARRHGVEKEATTDARHRKTCAHPSGTSEPVRAWMSLMKKLTAEVCAGAKFEELFDPQGTGTHHSAGPSADRRWASYSGSHVVPHPVSRKPEHITFLGHTSGPPHPLGGCPRSFPTFLRLVSYTHLPRRDLTESARNRLVAENATVML